jgi:hypothetical protein
MLLLMKTFNRWRPEVDRTSTELSKDVKQLTSCVEALEAQPKSAPLSSPSREEEGRAKGHGAETQPQGSGKGALVLQQPQANGQYPTSPPHLIDLGDSSQCYQHHMPMLTITRRFAYLRPCFQSLMAHIQKFGEKSVRSISICTKCLCICGLNLLPYIFMVVLHFEGSRWRTRGW